MTEKEKLLKQFSEYLKMRNYAESTYKAYMGTIRNFWKWCERRSPDPDFDKANAVQAYLAYRMKEKKLDYSTVNGDYSALQWFYKYILNREWNVRKLVRPRKEKRLPKYITPREVGELVRVTNFRKHQVMFLLYYSTGLRLSELRNLEWKDIKFDEGIIHVKGKGNKERIVILHEEMAELLKSYRKNQPELQVIVFEGRDSNKVIAARSVQHAFNEARKKAGLPDWVTPHVMRHSFATSSLKNGTDILTLKELLGHKKLATTARYLHLSTAYLKKSYNPLRTKHLNASIESLKRPER